jgi:Zn-finger protein
VEEVRMCARCKSVHWNTPANELPKMLKTKAKHRKLKNKAFNQKIANIIKNNN